MECPPDAELVAASLADPSVFGTIFDRHASTLHRYLVRRLGPDDADAMVGEVFRIAFEKRATFDCSRESARPWLYGIATNLVAKHRRREARRITATARLAAQRFAGSSEDEDRTADAIDARQLWPLVAEAVAGLPEPERDALILHVWEGLSYEEVAAALTVPVGTVRSRLNRARGRLRELRTATGGQQGHSAGRGAGRIGS